MGLKKRSWSDDEFERLKALVSSGVSALRVSVVLKRPIKAVKLKAKAIGTPFPHDSELKKERQRKQMANANGDYRTHER